VNRAVFEPNGEIVPAVDFHKSKFQRSNRGSKSTERRGFFNLKSERLSFNQRKRQPVAEGNKSLPEKQKPKMFCNCRPLVFPNEKMIAVAEIINITMHLPEEKVIAVPVNIQTSKLLLHLKPCHHYDLPDS